MLCPFPSISLGPGAHVDPYRLEHKAIRVMLGGLLENAGRVDFGDGGAVSELRAALERAIDVLHQHARSEVLFIDALLAAHAPAEATGVQRDHVDLDTELTHLAHEMEVHSADPADLAKARERGHALYLRLTRFVSSYLTHMAYEEEQVLPLLHRYVSGVALRRALLAAQSHLPFEQRAVTYVRVRAAIAPHERAALAASSEEDTQERCGHMRSSARRSARSNPPSMRATCPAPSSARSSRHTDS